MRILVCDDEESELLRISELLRGHYRGEAEVFAFNSPARALEHIRGGGGADAAILDILMPEMRGDRLAVALRDAGFDGFIVFLTASNEFAAESYEVSAFSYLLKPIDEAALTPVLRRIDERIAERRQKSFVVSWRGKTRLVAFRDLEWVEVRGHNLYLHLSDGETLRLYSALRDFEEIFAAEPSMARTHKSFYVNMDRVVALEEGYAVLGGGQRIPVSRSFASFEKSYFDWVLKGGGDGWSAS